MLSSLLSFFITPSEKIKVLARISPQQEIKHLEQLNETLFEVGCQLNRELSFVDNHIVNEKIYTIHRYVQGVHSLLKQVINFKKGEIIMDFKDQLRGRDKTLK